jgi:predicted enzyme related to lactoylglutathione lyase
VLVAGDVPGALKTGQGYTLAIATGESYSGKVVPPVQIPTGTFAWMKDPEGNVVGLWKAKK